MRPCESRPPLPPGRNKISRSCAVGFAEGVLRHAWRVPTTVSTPPAAGVARSVSMLGRGRGVTGAHVNQRRFTPAGDDDGVAPR